jgi:hypothetical protein
MGIFYIIMTYKRETTTILAIAIMAAAMVSASVVIALTLMTEGVGIPYAKATCKKVDGCGGGNGKKG